MKLRAPVGVGDPCVAGVMIAARDGVYEVEPEVGALLVECFGFVAVAAAEAEKVPGGSTMSRRSRPTSRRARGAE